MFLTLESAQSRSASIKAVTAMQCLIAVVYLWTGTFFVALSLGLIRARNVFEAFAYAAVPGMSFALGVAGIGLSALAGAFGMWRGHLWGWWMALSVDLVTAFGTAYYIFKDFSFFNAADIVLRVALAAIPLGWLLLPGVREFFWKS